jgi:PIN domain nuclease of toxin-antitoxin system
MADRPVYVTDTHSLLWYLYNPKRLGPEAARAFDEVAANEADLIVPVIVIAEIVYILQAGKVAANFDDVLSHLQASPNIVIHPLAVERAIELNTTTAVPEMHDRLIALEARAHGAKLIAHDQAISNAGVVATVW